MSKPLRNIVPIKEGWKRAVGMSAAAAGAGALVGASSIGGAPIGAPAGAAIALAGYALSGGLKKDWKYKKDKTDPKPLQESSSYTYRRVNLGGGQRLTVRPGKPGTMSGTIGKKGQWTQTVTRSPTQGTYMTTTANVGGGFHQRTRTSLGGGKKPKEWHFPNKGKGKGSGAIGLIPFIFGNKWGPGGDPSNPTAPSGADTGDIKQAQGNLDLGPMGPTDQEQEPKTSKTRSLLKFIFGNVR